LQKVVIQIKQAATYYFVYYCLILQALILGQIVDYHHEFTQMVLQGIFE